MKTVESRIIIIGILFLCMVVSGIWMSRQGKPYNNILFTLHKLSSLAAIILTAITVYRLQKGVELPAYEWLVIVLTGIVYILALVTGGIQSFDKPVHSIIFIIHKIAPFFVALFTSLAFYFLLTGKH